MGSSDILGGRKRHKQDRTDRKQEENRIINICGKQNEASEACGTDGSEIEIKTKGRGPVEAACVCVWMCVRDFQESDRPIEQSIKEEDDLMNRDLCVFVSFHFFPSPKRIQIDPTRS